MFSHHDLGVHVSMHYCVFPQFQSKTSWCTDRFGSLVCNIQSLVLETFFSRTTSPKCTFEFKEIRLQPIIFLTLDFSFSARVVQYRHGYRLSTVRNKVTGWRKQPLLADGWEVIINFVLMMKKKLVVEKVCSWLGVTDKEIQSWICFLH